MSSDLETRVTINFLEWELVTIADGSRIWVHKGSQVYHPSEGHPLNLENWNPGYERKDLTVILTQLFDEGCYTQDLHEATMQLPTGFLAVESPMKILRLIDAIMEGNENPLAVIEPKANKLSLMQEVAQDLWGNKDAIIDPSTGRVTVNTVNSEDQGGTVHA